jgi:hypothetical protein
MNLSKSEQLELLEKYNIAQLREKFGWEELYDVFTISQDEFIEWEITRPINSGISRQEGRHDGIYFIESNNEYEVYWQERGIVQPNNKQTFSHYKEARSYLAKGITPYFLFKKQ